MNNLYEIAYDFIPWAMLLSGIGSAAFLERMTIMGRSMLYVVGIWFACAASAMIGVGLMVGTRGTLFGEIVLGLGDVFLAVSLPTTVLGYWWQTRKTYGVKRAEYFNQQKRGSVK